MRRIMLVLSVAAMMAVMAVASAAPAMADVRFVDNHRLDNRADRIENRLEDLGFDVDLDQGDVFFVSPLVFGIDGLDLVDVDNGHVDFDGVDFDGGKIDLD